MKLIAIKNIKGLDNYSIGEEVKYIPWKHKWQGMTEPERVKKGIFVNCYGMGMFSVFRDGEDVGILT